jgi:hypothetical protein
MRSLRISRANLTHVRVPLVEPFVISSGVVTDKDAIVIELLADGLSGLGVTLNRDVINRYRLRQLTIPMDVQLHLDTDGRQ